MIGWLTRLSQTFLWPTSRVALAFTLWMAARFPGTRGLRAAVLLAQALLRTRPTSRPLGSMPPDDLMNLLGDGLATRRIISDRASGVESAADLLDRATPSELASPVAAALVREFDASIVGELLYQAIVLDQASIAPRTQSALRALTRQPALIPRERRVAVLRRTLRLAATPVSPYGAPGTAPDARLAAAALLEVAPELDDEIAALITAEGFTGELRRIVAAALAGRPEDRGGSVARFLQAWRAEPDDAIRFGEECDSNYSVYDPIAQPANEYLGLRRQISAFWPTIASALPYLVPVGLVVLAVTTRDVTAEWTRGLRVGLGSAFAAVGLLVAVNVVSAELSAARLPGLLARWTAVPQALRAGYVTAVALVVAVSMNTSALSVNSRELVAAAIPALVISFFVLLLWLLYALVRRTDPSLAMRSHERARRRRYRATARRFGRIQRDAIAFRRYAAPLAFCVVAPSSPTHARRSVITSVSRGFFVPAIRPLRRLSQRNAWHTQELILHVVNRLGLLVSPREELGAVVPAPGRVPTRRDLRTVRSILRIVDSTDVDEVAEAAVLGLEVLTDAARKGDAGGASRLNDSLMTLLGNQLALASRARGASDHDDVVPVHPAIAATARATARLLSEASTPPILRSELQAVVHNLLHLGQRSDAMVVAVMSAFLSEQERDHELDAFLAWEGGLRAVQLNDRGALFLTQGLIGQRLATGEILTAEGIEVSARLTVAAVWGNQLLAKSLWDWYVDLTAASGTEARGRIMGALRVGATALLAGNMSTAIRVALTVRGWADVALLEQMVRKPSVSQLEQVISDQYGQYLGLDAEDALASFCSFTTSIASAVPPAATAGSG